MKLQIRLTTSSSARIVQLTTEHWAFVKKEPFICVLLNCFAFRRVMPPGSYNYSAINSIKISVLSQRMFKTKGLISIEGTFFWTRCI